MKRRFLVIASAIIFIIYANSCIALQEDKKQEYGALMSAVSWSAAAVIGEYGHNIPDDFDSKKFMGVVKDKIPSRSYQIMEKYNVKIIPKKRYYLLLIYNSTYQSLILFDYSCTPDVDGPILLEPGKFDINHLEQYDKCKN